MLRRRTLSALVTVLVVAGLAVPAVLAQPGRAAAGGEPAVVLALDDVPTSTLSQQEIDGIVWMREEEKLARDVYQALSELYPLPAFGNIAASEQNHMDAIAALLARYGIDDPTAGKAAGEFTDPELQKLYDALLAQGKVSLTAALQVGATVEEVDIVDLRARASAAPDVALVYGVLERGSGNHLRAFTRLYENVSGAAYQPQYLDAADYARILAGA